MPPAVLFLRNRLVAATADRWYAGAVGLLVALHLAAFGLLIWFEADLEAQARLMGPSFEPNGLGEENRRMIARFCEEQHAQGLIPRPLDPDSVFAEFRALAG